MAKTPEQLVELIEVAQQRRAGLLFTATAAQDLDEIGAWSRLQDQATAGMWRAIVAAANRAGGYERVFIGDEVALSAGWSSHRGASEADLADSACSLPGVVEAVEDGLFTHWHARVLIEELDKVSLTLEQRQAVALIVLARYVGADVHQLRKDVRRLIHAVDPAAAAARKELADSRRHVSSWAEQDGQSAMLLRGPIEQLAAAMASLRASSAAQVAPDDLRTLDQRLFDTALGLLTGGLQAGSWHLDVVIPYSTSQGGEVELAEIPGFGALLPSTVRQLADLADTTRRVAVDEHGHVLTVDDTTTIKRAHRDQPGGDQPTAPDGSSAAAGDGSEATVDVVQCPLGVAIRAMTAAPVQPRSLRTSSYRISRRLERHLIARDRTCSFPGCSRPAQFTDKDHAIPWPLGPTSPDNLSCLCRRHHRAKHTVFTLRRLPDGTVRWITRGNQWHDQPPQGY